MSDINFSTDESFSSEDEEEALELAKEALKFTDDDNIKSQASKDLETGKALKIQSDFFDALMDLRISNSDLFSTQGFIGVKNEKKASEGEQFMAKAQSMLESLEGLRKEMLVADNIAFESKDNYNHIETAKAMDSALFDWRDKVSDEWNSQANASAPNLRKQFKAMNQNTSVLIQDALLDYDRLLKRTQQLRVSTENAAEIKAEETFDDTDFYQLLVRNYLDRKSKDGKGTKVIIEASTKLKQVDTKASKHRKLKYDAHEKLVNYMIPISMSKWEDKRIDELFVSLFGRSLQAKENETMKDDGFTLFG